MLYVVLERRIFRAVARRLRNYAPYLRLWIRNGADIDAPRCARRCRVALRPPAKTLRRGASPLRVPVMRVILIKLTEKYGCLVMPGLTQCAVRASEQIEISLAYC